MTNHTDTDNLMNTADLSLEDSFIRTLTPADLEAISIVVAEIVRGAADPVATAVRVNTEQTEIDNADTQQLRVLHAEATSANTKLRRFLSRLASKAAGR